MSNRKGKVKSKRGGKGGDRKQRHLILGEHLSDNSDALSDTKTQVGSNTPSLDDLSGHANGDHSGDDHDSGEGIGAAALGSGGNAAALDEALDDLTERKSATRLAALRAVQQGMLKAIPVDFLLKSHETLLSSLTSCVRKGEATEADLALTALATALVSLASVERESDEDKLVEMSFGPLVPMLERLLATHPSTRVRCKAASTLALGSLMATADTTETLRILDYLSSFWLTDSFTKKFQGNVKVRQKVVPPELSVATLDAWALLASALDDRVLIDTLFHSNMPAIIRVLAHESLEVRIAAGRCTALLYAAMHRRHGGGGASTSSTGTGGDSDSDSIGHGASAAPLPEVTDDVVELLSELASDASKSQSRDKRREQRTYFRKFLATVESGDVPEETLSLKGGRVTFYGWPQLIQLAAVRDTLKTGFLAHMHDNCFLIDMFNLEELVNESEQFDDKTEREYRKRSRHDFKKSRRQMKNAFRYHHHE